MKKIKISLKYLGKKKKNKKMNKENIVNYKYENGINKEFNLILHIIIFLILIIHFVKYIIKNFLNNRTKLYKILLKKKRFNTKRNIK